MKIKTKSPGSLVRGSRKIKTYLLLPKVLMQLKKIDNNYKIYIIFILKFQIGEYNEIYYNNFSTFL